MTIDEEIATLLYHDLSITLDANRYKGMLSPYECTLLYMINIGREYIKENQKNFNLLILNYDDEITVNTNFSITNYTSDIIETKENCHFVIEFIEDTANDKKYYIIQNKQKTKHVKLQGVLRTKSILDFTFKDFKKIIDAYLVRENIQEKDPVFKIVNHQVDFQLGSWIIDKPFLSIPRK